MHLGGCGTCGVHVAGSVFVHRMTACLMELLMGLEQAFEKCLSLRAQGVRLLGALAIEPLAELALMVVGALKIARAF